MHVNPTGPAYQPPLKRVKLEEPDPSWIQAGKEELCKYLSQFHLTWEVTPESIGVGEIRHKELQESELGAGGAGFPSPYHNGFVVHYTYAGMTYIAKIADWMGLRVIFPALQHYDPDLTKDQILRLLKEIDPEINPKIVRIIRSKVAFVNPETLIDSHPYGDLITEVFEIDLEIGREDYSFYLTKDCKRARNVKYYGREYGEFGDYSSIALELFNKGQPFFLSKCPEALLIEAKKRVEGELIDEEEVTITFSQSGEPTQGWHLTFQSGDEIYIDKSGNESIVISKPDL